MSGKPTEKVLALRPTRGKRQAALPQAYGEALREHFGNEYARCADRISTLLVNESDGPHLFKAYRLWIETLADAKDLEALAELRGHLFDRGREDPARRSTWAGLRGIVHLELDEFAAAKLLARSLASAKNDPYALEVCSRVASRLDALSPSPLLDCAVPLTDYFHWQTLARHLIASKLRARDLPEAASGREATREAIAEVMMIVGEDFRGSPLPLLFEYHQCIDAQVYAAAAEVASRLTEVYPECADYKYYQAYAYFEDGDYPTARRILTDTLRLVGESDAEVASLLGHCHAKLGEADKAAHFLKRAVSLLKDEGLPTSHVSLELANVEEEMRGEASDPVLEVPRVTNCWLVRLSPRRYHELMTSSESTLDRLLRPMGASPRPGDYTFFASESDTEEGHKLWKIIAIYAVDSEPMWHPVHGYHSALKLVKRLPDGIPLDVRSADDAVVTETDEAPTRLPKEHPLRYGVFALDSGALDVIEEAVRLHRDDMIERRRGGMSRRPTA